MKMNPFLVLGCIINIGAAGWYFYQGGIKMGLLFLGYTFTGAMLIWIGVF